MGPTRSGLLRRGLEEAHLRLHDLPLAVDQRVGVVIYQVTLGRLELKRNKSELSSQLSLIHTLSWYVGKFP